MPRAYIIGLVLLAAVAAGFSSRQYFKGVPVDVAPILGTESFYVVDSEGPSPETNFRLRKTLVRLDPDGTIHQIREIDSTLWMPGDVADESRILMLGPYGMRWKLYSVATGELSDVPREHINNVNLRFVEGHELDSLKMHPLIKDLQNPYVFRLPHRDCYLVRASVPGTGGCIITEEQSDSTGVLMSYSTMSPRIYWSVANMKRNTLTKVGDDAPPALSASGKVLVFHPHDENGKYYPNFVHLEDYIK